MHVRIFSLLSFYRSVLQLSEVIMQEKKSIYDIGYWAPSKRIPISCTNRSKHLFSHSFSRRKERERRVLFSLIIDKLAHLDFEYFSMASFVYLVFFFLRNSPHFHHFCRSWPVNPLSLSLFLFFHIRLRFQSRSVDRLRLYLRDIYIYRCLFLPPFIS